VKGVTLTGRLQPSDTLRAIAKACFVIVNSKVETFGMVALEALLAGTPVLATKTGVIESFWMGNPGKLIDSDNTLKEDLRFMMRNYRNFETVHSAEFIQQNCASQVVARQLEAVYQGNRM
jgi:glycosyltransferase involved in cell wall biosynthesis